MVKLKENQVYCGRGYRGEVPREPRKYGWLGNPIILGGGPCQNCGQIHNQPGDTLFCYKIHLLEMLEDGEWFDCFIEDCRDKELFCFCKNKERCHTSVMTEILDELLYRKSIIQE